MYRLCVSLVSITSLLLVLSMLTFFSPSFAAAKTQSGDATWVNSSIETLEYKDYEGDVNELSRYQHECTMQYIRASPVEYYITEVEEVPACVSVGESLRYAYGTDNARVYVSPSSSDLFYAIYPLGENSLSVNHIVNTNSFILTMGMWSQVRSIKYYDNILDHLTMVGGRWYDFDWNSVSTLTGDSWMDQIYGWGVSKNKRYFVYGKISSNQRAGLINMFILDSHTGHAKMFGQITTYGTAYGLVELPGIVVSNDGKQVAMIDDDDLIFWGITADCVVEVPHDIRESMDLCDSKLYDPIPYSDRTGFGYNRNLSVDDDFTELSYIYIPNSHMIESKVIKVGIVGQEVEDAESLKYIALGDSYSSGEGDVVGSVSARYLFENDESAFCHLSIKSYPYVLRAWWNIELSDMESVACSGARVQQDYMSNPYDYMGQDGSLKRKSAGQRKQRRQEALDNFIPGVVPQLEFIKRHKPKVITLTAGGNDVGFGDIIKTCASPEISLSGAISAGTCSYANDSKIKRILLDSIHNQYRVTMNLLSDIKWSSPDSKIYIIGYPKFIAEGAAICLANSGDLNSRERAMINSMQEELNNVLWRAAEDAGVEFVDIEESLEGGKMCQGSEYMTGLMDIGFNRIRHDDVQEAFHPNANGHTRMAEAIYEKVPSVSHIVSPTPRANALSGQEYDSSPIAKMLNMIKRVVGRLTAPKIEIDPATLQQGSTVNVTMYSDPIYLGSLTVDSDGGVDAEITLPKDVTMGYHTLVVEGLTATNQPITLYQHITVTSGIEGDMDGDGILDENDRCLFVVEWIDEASGEDVCDDSVFSTPSNTVSGQTGMDSSSRSGSGQPPTYATSVLYGHQASIVRDHIDSDSSLLYSQDNNIIGPNLRPDKKPENITTVDQRDTSSMVMRPTSIALVGVFLIITLYLGVRRYNARKTK